MQLRLIIHFHIRSVAVAAPLNRLLNLHRVDPSTIDGWWSMVVVSICSVWHVEFRVNSIWIYEKKSISHLIPVFINSYHWQNVEGAV